MLLIEKLEPYSQCESIGNLGYIIHQIASFPSYVSVVYGIARKFFSCDLLKPIDKIQYFHNMSDVGGCFYLLSGLPRLSPPQKRSHYRPAQVVFAP